MDADDNDNADNDDDDNAAMSDNDNDDNTAMSDGDDNNDDNDDNDDGNDDNDDDDNDDNDNDDNDNDDDDDDSSPIKEAAATVSAESLELLLPALLRSLKLDARDDFKLYHRLVEWIDTRIEEQQQAESVPTITNATSQTAVALVLQRLLRAFAQRTVLSPTTAAVATPVATTNNNDPSLTAPTTTQNGDDEEAPTTTKEEIMEKAAGEAEAAEESPPNSPAPSQHSSASASSSSSSSSLDYSVIYDLGEGNGNFLGIRNLKLSPKVTSALLGVLTDLAHTLALLNHNMAKQTTSNHNHHIYVVEIITQCLELLDCGSGNDNKDTPDEPPTEENAPVVQGLLQATTFAHNNNNNNNNTANALDQKRLYIFLVRTLLVIRRQAVVAVERSLDFDYLYSKTCTRITTTSTTVTDVNGIPTTRRGGGSPSKSTTNNTVCRDLTWKLAGWVCLKNQTATQSLLSRRHAILAMAASLVVLVFLELVPVPSLNNNDNNTNNNAAKRQRRHYYVSDETSEEDVLDRILRAANSICSFLAWASFDEGVTAGSGTCTAWTRPQVETEVFSICNQFKSVPSVQQGTEPSVSPADGTTNTAAAASTKNYYNPSSPFWKLLKASIHKPLFIKQNFASILQQMWSETMAGLTVTSSSDLLETKIPVEVVPFWDLHAEATMELYDQFCPRVSRRPYARHHIVAVVPNKHRKLQEQETLVDQVTDAVSTKMTEMEGSPSAGFPPVLTDAMELNEWAISVLSLSVVKPSAKLLSYLSDTTMDAYDSSSSTPGGRTTSPTTAMDALSDVICPVLNRAMGRIHQDAIAPFGGMNNSTPMPSISIGQRDGQVYVDGEITPDVQLCASAIGLFYHALEAILYEESVRLKITAQEKLVQSDAFHRALLVCCYTCVLKAVGTSRKVILSPKNHELTIYSLLQTIESSPFTYLKVTESFQRALTQPSSRGKLGSPILFGLPRILQSHVKRTEMQVMDSVVWAREPSLGREGSLVKAIDMLQNMSKIGHLSSWPPEALVSTLPEEIEDADGSNEPESNNDTTPKTPVAALSTEAKFVSYILRKLLKISFLRIQDICKALGIPKEYPAITTQIWVAYRYLLRHHVDLLYDRHVDQLILCTIYGICKIMMYRPVISFSRIIEVYVAVRGQELGERSCQRIVRHIKLVSDGDVVAAGTTRVIGNVINLYNDVYVPKMKKHLLRSKSLKRNTAVLAVAMDSPSEGGGAFRASPFPYNGGEHDHLFRARQNSNGDDDMQRISGQEDTNTTFLHFGGGGMPAASRAAA
jgi:hypothetical protein